MYRRYPKGGPTAAFWLVKQSTDKAEYNMEVVDIEVPFKVSGKGFQMQHSGVYPSVANVKAMQNTRPLAQGEQLIVKTWMAPAEKRALDP